MFRWFETRIEAFPDEPPARPPETLLAFYIHFIKPVWPAFAVLLVAGFAGLADRGGAAGLRRQPGRHDEGGPVAAAFLTDHGGMLLWMAFVAAGRPAGGLDRARPDQEPDHRRAGDHPRALADAPLRAAPEPRLLPERLRRPRRQQGDAGGTGAARVGRAGDRRHLVCGRAVGRRGRHLRRRRLAPADPADGLARRLHRRALLLRAAHQGALDGGGRGALDAGRAHRRQLHQHPHRQAVRPRRARGRLCPRGAARSRWPSGRPRCASQTAMELVLYAPQRHPDRRRHAGSPSGCGARTPSRIGAIAVVSGLVHAHRRHVGLDPVGGRRHLREHRRGAGRHGDDQPAEPGASTGRTAGRWWCAQGEIRFENISFHYGQQGRGRHRAAGRDHPRFVAATSRRARRWAWSAAPAPASRRSSTCCCASTTWRAAASSSTGRTSPTSRRTACARRSAW